MNLIDQSLVENVLDWCASILGPFEVVVDTTRQHPGKRASVMKLRTATGDCFLKIHLDPAHWASEVHGYECWAPAFGPHASQLLAVRDVEPLALVISALPGLVLEEISLSPVQEIAVWRDAGCALAGLHDLPTGEGFGPCRRDGKNVGALVTDAVVYVSQEFDNWLERGKRGGYLSTNELAVVQTAMDQTGVFAGERPIACHRDYCPANWLINQQGKWTGVIDFEFAYWDVRAADFSRYPNWDWIQRPELARAFFEGYGRSFTLEEEQQILIAHTQYALGAVVWGMENEYFGFAQEGHLALDHLKALL